MGSVSGKIATGPQTDRQPMCDHDLLRLLLDQQGHSISEMVAHFLVTATAIRQRLIRLTGKQLVTRKRDDEQQQGRPKHLYYITSQGAAALADVADEGVALQESTPQPVSACHKTTAGRAEGEIMARILKKAAAKPPTDQQRRSDNDLLRLLADKRGRSVRNMAEHFSVTQAAIRERLGRLMLTQAVTRKRDDITFGRGKTCYLYYITRQGVKALAETGDEGVALKKSRPWLVWG